MTTPELFVSLNSDQTTAVNSLLIEQRDTLVSTHVKQLAEAVANDQAQKAEIIRLTALVPIPVVDEKAKARAEFDAAQQALAEAQAKLEAVS